MITIDLHINGNDFNRMRKLLDWLYNNVSRLDTSEDPIGDKSPSAGISPVFFKGMQDKWKIYVDYRNSNYLIMFKNENDATLCSLKFS